MKMEFKHVLGVTDYAVIVLNLLLSVGIGIKFRYFSAKQRTMKEYVMAGQNMSLFPVVISLCVTMMSSINIIGNPVETYRYGMQPCIQLVGLVCGMLVTTCVFTPVYFNCEVSTVYEYLELRYGKTTRYAVSGLFIIQMVFLMSSMLYAPVLAISAVTDLSLEMSIIVFGLVCSFYCSIGGLKAVLWTDVFQAGFMIVCLVVMYVQGIKEGGGMAEIYRLSRDGQRWNLLNIQMDLTTRYTLWNTFMRGFLGALVYYGANQVEVQRLQSLSTTARAQAALRWCFIPSALIYMLCLFMGMILYSIFYTCDPVQDKQHTGITRYDQVVPYYIVTRFSWIPGLTGVCVAGIISGSLSTISSALNSVSTVTVIDFIKPIFSNVLTEKRKVLLSKTLSMVYGIICIGLTFAVSKSDSLVAVTGTLIGIMEGPMLAIFLVGVLTRKGSEKCILFGLLLGVTLMSWIGYGAVFSGYKYPSLPLNSTGCSSNFNSSNIFQNSTCSTTENCQAQLFPEKKFINEPFILYRISYLWMSTIGCITTLFFILVAILLTGWNYNVIPADSKCLSPVTRYWIRTKPSHNKSLNGIQHIPLEERTALSTLDDFND